MSSPLRWFLIWEAMIAANISISVHNSLSHTSVCILTERENSCPTSGMPFPKILDCVPNQLRLSPADRWTVRENQSNSINCFRLLDDKQPIASISLRLLFAKRLSSVETFTKFEDTHIRYPQSQLSSHLSPSIFNPFTLLTSVNLLLTWPLKLHYTWLRLKSRTRLFIFNSVDWKRSLHAYEAALFATSSTSHISANRGS